MSILNIDNVSKSFDGFRAINDLNLAIGKGELRITAAFTELSNPSSPLDLTILLPVTAPDLLTEMATLQLKPEVPTMPGFHCLLM